MGLFFFGLIFGIVAIVNANTCKKAGYSGGKATAGLVLGIIDIIGWAFILLAAFAS